MASRARLDELLEAVRTEFDSLTRETSRYKDDHHEYELKLNQQHQELTNISNTVYELEQAHRSIKEAYEREIIKLKQELEIRDRLLEQHSIQQHQFQQMQQAQQQAQQAQPAHSLTATPQQLPPPNLSVSPATNGNGTAVTANKPVIAPFTAVSNGAQSSASSLPPPNTSTPPILPPPPQTALSQASGSSSVAESTLKPLSDIKKSPIATENVTPATNAPIAGVEQPATEPPASVSDVTLNAAAPETTAVAITGERKRAQHNKPIPAFLKDFDAFASLPYKKQHNDYYLVYNPNIPKKVDISLVHSFDHTSVVCCVRFSKDGKFLATGCNKLTQVFSVETGELIARLSDESSLTANNNSGSNNANNSAANATGGYDTDTGDLYIRSVCFSPDGKFLATGAEDKIIRIWDLTTRKIVKYLKGHEQDIYSLDFFPDGKRLVSGSGDRTVRIWDVFNGQCSLTLSIEDGVTTVAVSPDGSLIAAGSLDRTVRVWDANKGYLVERLDSSYEYGNGHMDSVYSVTFTNQGKEIASGSLDRTIKLWTLKDLEKQHSNVAKSDCEVTYVGHKDFVLSVCCTPDDEFILSGSKDRGVIMWDKKTSEPYIMLQGHRNSVISVSVSPVINPAGGYFATGSGDCKARIWKWERITEVTN